MNRGGRFFIYLGLCFCLVLLPFVFSAEPDTYLEIPNSAPILIKPIPNQSWPGGTNLTDSFDLDDYFEDAENYLNYSFLDVENISIVIDSENVVSFYPDPSFLGTQTTRFNASDGELWTLSNLVYLYVGEDIFPPKWFNPRTDNEKVYQNTVVNFFVDWVDNFELYNYSFEVNQEGVWSTYSGFLNGSSSTAQHPIQISSPAGKVVEWRGCAWDTAANYNCTDIEEFDVLVTPQNPPSSGDEGGEEETAYDSPTDTFREYVEDIFSPKPESDFSFSANYFAVSLKQGESKTRIFEIYNTGEEVLNFSLGVEKVSEFVELSEESFELFPGETKSITMDFRARLDTELGEYFGALAVDSFKESKIPIAITVNDVDLDFEVLISILNEKKTVKPGKEVKAKLDIKNLKDEILTDAVLQYSIKDFEGNIYNSGEENVSFVYLLSLERSLEVSDEAPLGPYIFYARVFNEKASALNSAAFNVGTRFEFAYYFRLSIIFFFIVVFSFIILILISRYRKQVDKGKALNLYVKLNEMRDLINDGKFEKAANVYIGIKKIYGQRVSQDILDDKEKLAEEIKKLSGQIDLKSAPPAKKGEGKKKENKAGEPESKEEVSDSEEIGEGESSEASAESDSDKEAKPLVKEEAAKTEEKPSSQKAATPTPTAKKEVKKPVTETKAPVTEKKVVAKPAQATKETTKKVLVKKVVGKPVAKPAQATKETTKKEAVPQKKVVAKPVTKKIVNESAEPAKKAVAPVKEPAKKPVTETKAPVTENKVVTKPAQTTKEPEKKVATENNTSITPTKEEVKKPVIENKTPVTENKVVTKPAQTTKEPEKKEAIPQKKVSSQPTPTNKEPEKEENKK